MKIYLLANIFLVLTLAIFTGMRRLTACGNRIPNRPLLHLGQVLIFLSLLAAVVVPSLPFRNHAEGPLSSSQFWDPDSGSRNNSRRGNLSLRVAPRPRLVTNLVSAAHQPGNFGLLLISLAMAVLLTRLGLGLRELRAFVASATCYRRIRRLEIRVSDDIHIPFAARALRSAYIVVPMELLASRKEFFIAVRHELQHHRQGDTLWVYANELLKIAFFFNPAIFAWAREISELQELTCDETIVSRGVVRAYDYGHCLLQVAERQLAHSKSLMGTTGMSHGGSGPRAFLRRRIQMLDSHTTQGSALKVGLVVLVNTAALALLVIGSASVFGKPGQLIPSSLLAGDPEIKSIAETALTHGLEQSKAQAAFAVISDVNDGTLLATIHASADSEGKITIDRNQSDYLSEPSSPWSVSKPLIVAVAINQGLVHPGDLQNCEHGAYTIDGMTIHDWDAFDLLSTAQVLAQSSNIGAVKIAEKIGGTSLVEGLRSFGFERFTHTGDPEARLAAYLAIGQALQSTPLEIAQAYAALGNGGKLFQPRAYGDSSRPQLIREVISADTSREMREMLAGVVTSGTGQAATTTDFTTAGKTGTGWRKKFNAGKEHDIALASFAGFAPATHPRLAIYIVVEQPKDPHPTGGVSAAPIFSEIAEKALSALHVPSDRAR